MSEVVFENAQQVEGKYGTPSTSHLPAWSASLSFVGSLVLYLCFNPASARAQDRPLPPREAAAAMKTPEGFKVSLFAGEPDIVQPIAFTFDDRGRLWVCENFSYPGWIKNGKPGKDRITILEDTDGDGVHDNKTVFADNLANLTSIEYGFGGVFVTCAPNLLFIPIKPGTVEPGGPPEKLLDGWSLESVHNMVNGLKWGPDGWLYGCHGILATSHVGPPGSPKDKRTPINCGVWRFHPVTKNFEAFAHGTTNPWGIDWDEYGQMFITNCVIDHAFHVVQGGRYIRMYGQDLNPYTYKLMPSCVDHLHWGGGPWTESRGGKGKHSEAGGGHAHSGCMIYLGDSFPEKYRNTLFTCNLHGSRVNNDRLERTDKGYVAMHSPDFVFAKDTWFRGIAINYGPDGSVYVSDWNDTGECHNYKVADQTNGRIFKITHDKATQIVRQRPAHLHVRLDALGNEDLLFLQRSKNEWLVRHARRILQERAATHKVDAVDLSRRYSQKKLKQSRDLVDMSCEWGDADPALIDLRVNMTFHAMGVAGREWLENVLDQRDEKDRVYAWALRHAMDEGAFHTNKDLRNKLIEHASRSKTRDTRLEFASGLQRYPLAYRFELAKAVLSTHRDFEDSSLSLLLWYGVEPLARHDVAKAAALVEAAKVPLLRELLSRRIASADLESKTNEGLNVLVEGLPRIQPAEQVDVLRGMQSALEGVREFPMPKGWPAAFEQIQRLPYDEAKDRAFALAVIFGDTSAIATLQKLARSTSAAPERRQQALNTLLVRPSPELREILVQLLREPALQSSAIRGLAAFADVRVPADLLGIYPSLKDAEKADVIATLSGRKEFALALLDAVEKKTVDRRDLSTVTVRQLLALKDGRVAKRVAEVWGALRPAGKDKAALIKKYRDDLTPDAVKVADHGRGRLVYMKHCATCHKLFGEGGNLGPDLTGSQRKNLDYLLENMLDPNAAVPREYQVIVVTTTAGRTLSGLVKQETERALTLQTANEVVVIPRNEIEERSTPSLSLMPEGVLDRLTLDEVRALVAYLGRSEAMVEKK